MTFQKSFVICKHQEFLVYLSVTLGLASQGRCSSIPIMRHQNSYEATASLLFSSALVKIQIVESHYSSHYKMLLIFSSVSAFIKFRVEKNLLMQAGNKFRLSFVKKNDTKTYLHLELFYSMLQNICH